MNKNTNHIGVDFLKLVKKLMTVLVEREAALTCPAHRNRQERKEDLTAIVSFNHEINEIIKALKAFEELNNGQVGVSSIIDINCIPDCIYAAASVLLLSRLSEEVQQSLRCVSEVISLLACRDIEKGMLIREAFAVDGVLYNICNMRPDTSVDEARISCKESQFQKAIPSLGVGLSYLLEEGRTVILQRTV
jgi:hypothetical protein